MTLDKNKKNSRYIDFGERGKYDTKNTLNDLTGKEWIKFTKSWKIYIPKPRKADEFEHPAKFPEELIEEFIRFFTKKGDLVLDPFLGCGTTARVCQVLGRNVIGIELINKYYNIARKSLQQTTLERFSDIFFEIIKGDSKKILKIWEEHDFGKVDYCITSPPYWDMLKKSRGGVESISKQRKKLGVDQYYSDENPDDLGNIEDYNDFIEILVNVFEGIYKIMKKGSYLTIIIQNIRATSGEMIPFAWDLALRLSKTFQLVQEKLWLQNDTKLGIWGYPKIYVSNVAHHYCLNFRKI